MSLLRQFWEGGPRRDPNTIAYVVLLVGAIFFPLLAQVATGGNSSFIVTVAADAGVYVLLAIGLNVVVGFAGLLDLGYAAFFAIGAYTYAFLASDHGRVTPLGEPIHMPFWIVLLIAMFVAASFGVLLGAPTLRLRGDYLAIVTLGFGEIVPRIFKNAATWTSGVNGISALDIPALPVWLQGPWSGDPLQVVTDFKILSSLAYYVIMVILLIISVILVRNLHRSRLGRAWMAVREDEVAAAAMGVNTTAIKLLAFSIGAAFSGFAGTFYAAKLSLVSPENFGFSVSITILVMVVLGGMGNIPGVILGSLAIYGVIFILLPQLPEYATGFVNQIGLSGLTQSSGDYPGIAEFISRLKFLVFGLILVVVMLWRPQGLLPSRQREQELKKGIAHEETVIEDVTAEVG
ncbi:MAG TPA: ABC transporter ATP-binding protein [Candidatus Limnocylindria bacterium]|jgi:branched-chain amino acid transport system permease protein|nr:ABC transporter ATP-binding protein [Candidatus Limnocylindria bacterium]